MAPSKKKPKRLTREEVETMPHSELSSVKTKRRLLASLPSATEGNDGDQGTDAADDENLTPRERMVRGQDKLDRAREKKEAGNGSDES